jgi:hypothetical protein
MFTTLQLKSVIGVVVAALVLAVAPQVPAEGKKNQKQELKKLNKEAKKVGSTAEAASAAIGRDKVFCILAAHTSDVGTAQELKDKYESLDDFPFGQFVAAVLLADRLDLSLDAILTKLQDGMSIGQITKEAGESMGDVRKHFGEIRSELARAMTNPPTRNCFEDAPQ